jgi:16S rRNA (cytosine967-C5)-methyltransferase
VTSPARRAAFEVLCRIEIQNAHSDDALRIASVQALKQRDRNLVTGIVYATLRRRAQLDWILASASSRPWRDVDEMVKVVLRMGLLQMWRLDRVPDYAAVSDAVDLIRSRGLHRAAGFVNAVLRSAGRSRLWADPGFEESLPAPCRACLPEWLWNRWASRYGEDLAMRYAVSLNEPPRPAFRLPLESRTGGNQPDPIPSEIVPGAYFAAGELSPGLRVMDEASQLVPYLLGVEPGWRVWDACAAPGGKSSILLELVGEAGAVFSSDSSLDRAFLMKTAISGTVPAPAGACRILVADARQAPLRRPFNAVLVDAPCSGLGTLRRNPEIKWRMSEERLARYQALQLEILGSASDSVAPSGRLLYSTCSTEPEENEQVVSLFLDSRPGFELVTPSCPPGVQPFVDGRGFVRTFPGPRPWDGFFAALFVRHGQTL